MADESFPPNLLALTASRRGNGWSVARQRAFLDAMDVNGDASGEGTGLRAGDQDEQNRRKADSVSKLSKVKAPDHPFHTVVALINAKPLRQCKLV